MLDRFPKERQQYDQSYVDRSKGVVMELRISEIKRIIYLLGMLGKSK